MTVAWLCMALSLKRVVPGDALLNLRYPTVLNFNFNQNYTSYNSEKYNLNSKRFTLVMGYLLSTDEKPKLHSLDIKYIHSTLISLITYQTVLEVSHFLLLLIASVAESFHSFNLCLASSKYSLAVSVNVFWSC